MTVDWKIAKPQERCYTCQNRIKVGQEYVAALAETDEGLCRRDYCLGHWHDDTSGIYCFWRTRLPDPDRKKQQLLIDDDMLMSFFERLSDDTEPERRQFRFVLALVLMRRRRLRYESTHRSGDQEFWRLKVVGRPRSLDVLNPQLDESQIEQLTSQIGQILNTQLEV